MVFGYIQGIFVRFSVGHIILFMNSSQKPHLSCSDHFLHTLTHSHRFTGVYQYWFDVIHKCFVLANDLSNVTPRLFGFDAGRNFGLPTGHCFMMSPR